MYAVIKIHNNSLSKITLTKDEQDAKDMCISWAESQFERELDDDEIDDFDNDLEIFNDDDPDNIYCFTIAIAETI